MRYIVDILPIALSDIIVDSSEIIIRVIAELL
jgi:hypothetical protein